MINKKKAFTLVEITIGIFIFSILLLVVMNVFSSGMKGSQKALSHQDNMEAANILMAQIEYDLSRATKITFPDWNDTQPEAQWKFESEDGKEVTFFYEKSSEGVHRNVTGDGVAPINYYFAKGHIVNISFTHFAVDAGGGNNDDLLVEKHGMWIDLEVGDPKGKYPSFTMNKLIVVRRPF